MPRRIRKDPPHRRPAPPPGLSGVHLGADLDADTVEFGRALEEFKRQTGRRFLTNAETLGVLKSLGYARAITVPVNGEAARAK